MARIIYLIISIALLIIGISDSAAEKSNNPTVKSLKGLIAVSLEEHPDIKILVGKRKQVLAERKIAAQIPNPEFDSRLLYNFDDKGLKGEYGLTQTIELGGKRRARIARAKNSRLLIDKKIIVKKGQTINRGDRLIIIQ